MDPLIIKVDADEAANLQYMNVEVEASKRLISKFIDTCTEPVEISSKSFSAYNEIYQKRCEDFDKAKRELEDKYISDDIRSKMKDWSLKYHSAEIEIIFE